MKGTRIVNLLGRSLAGLSLLALLAGCGGGSSLRCLDDERYRDSASAPPVRVPDDLSLPDETDAVNVPPPPRAARERPADSCLESPPDLFEGQRSG